MSAGVFVVTYALFALLALWAAASLLVARAGGLFSRRRLPPTRHVERVKVDVGI